MERPAVGKGARVCCLYRVSTKKQVEENDIPMQKNACREFIAAMPGWVLAGEYAEKGVSGYHKSAGQRDVLQQVKKDAERGLFDVLLVFMFDRLGRREDETPFVVEWFAAQGIEVWSVTEGQQRFDSRADKLINYIRYWQSGGESEKTSIRVAEKHRQMVEEGRFRGGSPPYGYRLVNSGDKNRRGCELKKLAVDEDESRVVRDIFNLVTERGYGGHRVAAHLNDRRVPTKRGNRWTAYGVLCLLKNPIYMGLYVSGRRKTERGQKKRAGPGEWIRSKEILPELVIVDAPTWHRAEEIRNARKENSGAYPAQTKGPLLFAGLARCGSCGGALTSRYAVKRWTRKSDGKETRYSQPQYVCKKNGAKRVCAGQHSYSRNKIDPVILEEVRGCLGALEERDLGAEIDAARAAAAKSDAAGLAETAARVRKAESELNALNNEIIKCLTGESEFTAGQLAAGIAQKEEQLERLRAGEAEAEVRLNKRLAETRGLAGREMTPDWRAEFEAAPREVKKMLLARLIDSVHVLPGEIEVRFRHNPYRR